METKEALAAVRKQNGMTQDEMAARLFVTRQAVSRWETGETTPNVDTLKLMSETFGLSINELLGEPASPECQSCGMTLSAPEDFGTEADEGINAQYCSHCYHDGAFSSERTIDEMVESNLEYLDEYNREMGTSFSVEDARTVLREHLATLKRWQ